MRFLNQKPTSVIFPLMLAMLFLVGCTGFKSSDYARRVLPPCEKGKHAMWTWHTHEISSGDAINEFISFCKENNIGLVFLHIKNSPIEIQPLIAACGKNGIRVHALKGSPRMARKANHHSVIKFIDDICDYNRQCQPEAQIKGIHLDVEPYLLKEFTAKSADKVFREYLILLEKAREHAWTTNPNLLLGADIPFWLDKRDNRGHHKYSLKRGGKTKPVSEHVIDRTDYICIMSYRNYLHGTDGVINISRGELSYSERVYKHVFVGLETGEGKGIPPKTTFAGKGSKELKSAVIKTKETFRKQAAFSGISIHHYKSWKCLK